MTNITLSLPDDLKQQMSELPEINWSVVAREAIKEKIAKLSILKSISAKSKLTQKDALELGKKINKSLHEKYKDESSN